MSQRRDSRDSDALLPGKGHSASYGINESTDLEGSCIDSSGKSAPSVIQSIFNPSSGERVWAVAMCSIIACIAAIVNGIVIGYSSPTLSQLGTNHVKLYEPGHYIDPESRTVSLFGVSLKFSNNTDYYLSVDSTLLEIHVNIHIFTSASIGIQCGWCHLRWSYCLALV